LSFTCSDFITLQNSDSYCFTASQRALGDPKTNDTFKVVGTANDFCKGLKIYNCTFRKADSGAFLGAFLEGAVFEN
jgi:hypothetical protein